VSKEAMNLVFKNNFQTSFKKLLLESKKSKKQTGLILNTTSKKHSISPILLPVRKTSNLICLGMTISKKNQLSNFLKNIDGKFDYIFIDAEQKSKELINLVQIVEKNIHKSKIFTYKNNDSTAEAADTFLQQLIDFSKNNKISIVGAGNIGSKLALKLVERGHNVFLSRRKLSDSLKIATALNLIKPKVCTAKVIGTDLKFIAKNCNILISFSTTPIINKKMIIQMSKNGIILDGGIGTLKNDAILLAHSKNIEIIRLDARAGFSGTLTTLFETKELVEKIFGTKKIKNIEIIAGGFYGKSSSIVVDRLDHPSEIIGIADGKGGLKRKNYLKSEKNNIKIINTWIKKTS
jgi:hypothetical protein